MVSLLRISSHDNESIPMTDHVIHQHSIVSVGDTNICETCGEEFIECLDTQFNEEDALTHIREPIILDIPTF